VEYEHVSLVRGSADIRPNPMYPASISTSHYPSFDSLLQPSTNPSIPTWFPTQEALPTPGPTLPTWEGEAPSPAFDISAYQDFSMPWDFEPSR
jgi:hypothetical protein